MVAARFAGRPPIAGGRTQAVARSPDLRAASWRSMGRLRDARSDRAQCPRRRNDARRSGWSRRRRSLLGAAAKEAFSRSGEHCARSLRIAAIATSALGANDPEVTTSFEAACKTISEMAIGSSRSISIPGAMLLECARTLICVGIAAIPIENIATVDRVVREMYEHGRKVSAADYINLVAVMHNTARAIVQRLDAYDALVTPTMTKPAMRNGSFPSRPERYLDELWTWIAFEYPFNATGQPAITLPAGFRRRDFRLGYKL